MQFVLMCCGVLKETTLPLFLQISEIAEVFLINESIGIPQKLVGRMKSESLRMTGITSALVPRKKSNRDRLPFADVFSFFGENDKAVCSGKTADHMRALADGRLHREAAIYGA